jgi:titin
VNYGQRFFVGTPDTDAISQITFIRLGSVTHGFNMEQRISRLSFTSVPGGYEVTAPAQPNVAPPGHYMLFLLNRKGVPSVARIVRIGGSAGSLPPAPTGLRVTATALDRIGLAWTDGSEIEDGFKVERSQDGSHFETIATLGRGVTEFSDSSLPAGTTFFYRLLAYNGAGSSTYSAAVQARTGTPPAPPVPPGNLTAQSVSPSQINLSWSEGSGAAEAFRIESSLDGASFIEVATVAGTQSSYAHTGLAAGTKHYYRIRSQQGGLFSSYSNLAEATTSFPPPQQPAAPSNLIATGVSTGQINLSWTDNSGDETGFRIERSTNGHDFTEVGTPGANVTSYQHTTGLVAATKYYFRVRAVKGALFSEYSNVADGTTLSPPAPPSPPSPPTAPSNLIATAVSTSQINLAWTDGGGDVEGIQIERSDDGSVFQVVATVVAGVTTFGNTGLSSAVRYYYRVCAYKGATLSAYSDVASATTAASTPTGLTAPSALTATALSSSQIALAWKDNSSGEIGFSVERSLDGVHFTVVGNTGPGATSYTNSNLHSQTRYHYRIRALHGAGSSVPSNTASAVTLSGPVLRYRPPSPPRR